jgi:hypothetical protein
MRRTDARSLVGPASHPSRIEARPDMDPDESTGFAVATSTWRAATPRICDDLTSTLPKAPLIPKSLWDVTTSTGFDGGVLITTMTGTDQYAGEATLGQSNGYLSGPQTC